MVYHYTSCLYEKPHKTYLCAAQIDLGENVDETIMSNVVDMGHNKTITVKTYSNYPPESDKVKQRTTDEHHCMSTIQELSGIVGDTAVKNNTRHVRN